MEKLKTSSVYAYDTQYQQQPRARDGSYYFNEGHILQEREENGERIFEPVARPKLCDVVFAVMDTATKTGKHRDATGVAYYAYSRHPTPHAVILDWELIQIEADLLITWLPNVLARCEQLARECGARGGSLGALIEDKDSGQVLLQQAKRLGLRVKPIESKLTALGKDGRALSVSGYVHSNKMKICREAYDKTCVWRGRSANHFVLQVTTFRIGVGTANDSDELFDCFCYGNAIAFGNAAGF